MRRKEHLLTVVPKGVYIRIHAEKLAGQLEALVGVGACCTA
jgi:hypothetical protein